MEKERTRIADELISVVVPVYNVEKYLERCVDSIIKQTYKNLDIILVDDGSPDNSGKICDNYKEKYTNIRVIHQKNQGLSVARNNGLAVAKGSYITFVDSDDWIAPDMVSVMYKNLKKSYADISVIGFYNVYEDRKMVKNTIGNKTQIMTSMEALECFLFNGYITPCVWGKLYKIDIWSGVKCPPGKLFEDQYTTYKLLDKANKIVFNPYPYYYYLKRNGSIGHSGFSEKTYELYEGIQEEYKFIISKYPQIKPNVAVGRIIWEIAFVNMMFMKGKTDQRVVSKLRRFAYKHILDVIKCKYINGIRKIQILLFISNIWLYKQVYFKYKQKIGIN